MKTNILLIFLLLFLQSKHGSAQNKKQIPWHDLEKPKTMEYFFYTDSINSLGITVKNHEFVSYIIYLPKIVPYPTSIDAWPEKFGTQKKYGTNLELECSPYRTDNLNNKIASIEASFTQKFLQVNLTIHPRNGGPDINLHLFRNRIDDYKVIKDINRFQNAKNKFNSKQLNKELKCIAYADSNIVSAIFLEGGYQFAKSKLIPITFDRKNLVILNRRKINIPDSIMEQFKFYNYRINISEKQFYKELDKKASYFIFNNNRIMFYYFFYGLKENLNGYQYGVQIPKS